MIRGLYTSTAGMATDMDLVEMLSNDISNMSTPGYKTEFASLSRTPATNTPYAVPGGASGTAILQIQTSIDSSQGTMERTKNPWDLAISGTGMFAVQTPNGIAYTRNGHFHVDANGSLVTDQGFKVLGQKGPITIPSDTASIGEDGTISANGQTIDKVAVYQLPPSTGWTSKGNSLYTITGTATLIATPSIQQGYIEGSNVDPALTMTNLMSAERSYQASVQALHMQDSTLQSAVTDLGKLP